MNLVTERVPEPPFPTDCRGPTLVGFAVLLLALGGFLLWAALMPLSSAVVAGGTVTVDSHSKTIKHLEGGVVAELEVREGQAVEADQVLLRLDDTRLLAAEAVLRSRLASERARAARLRAEQTDAEAVRFPDDLVQQSLADPEVLNLVGSQVDIFETRRAARQGEIEILRQRSDQLRLQVGGLEKRSAALRAQLSLAHEELEALRDLEERGYAPRSRRLTLEREKEEIEAAYATASADLGRDREAMGEVELEMAQVGRRFQQEVAAELREARAAEHDLREEVRAVSDRLGRTVVRAPVDGRVVGLQIHAVGAVVEPGEALMDVVPADEPLVVEAEVAPADIHNVQVGQDAEIRFAAFRGRNAPIIEGYVTLVSPDSLVEPATGASYYAVRVVVPEEELAELARGAAIAPLIPGMPAEVVILTGERTVLRYLLDPLTDTLRVALRED